MSLGRKKRKEQEFWVPSTDLPQSPGHPFYQKLNKLLEEADFDEFVEGICAPFYSEGKGRPSIPPGVYFRMLILGYFEGLDSQRGIAWRCSDSLSIRGFLGLSPTEASPDHSSLTRIRQRLPGEVHYEVFSFVLEIGRVKELLKGKTVATDSTYLEANAAMKAIVRRDSGEDWTAYLKRLAKEAGVEAEDDAALRRFDRKRKGKKVGNDEWMSPTDPESRITKLKDGRTHLGYKAENTVDLDSDMLLAAEVYHADQADTATLTESLETAKKNAKRAGLGRAVKEVVGDKGYHKAALLVACCELAVRSYIVEPARKGTRRWTDKPPLWDVVYHQNRSRTRGERGKQLQRLRSEKTERSFAHVCETGGMRRMWLRGLENVRKRYLIQGAAYNLGVIMRRLFGTGTPRGLQDAVSTLFAVISRRMKDDRMPYPSMASWWIGWYGIRAFLRRASTGTAMAA